MLVGKNYLKELGVVMYNTIIDQKSEILSAIISTCLWSEPHLLDEILLKLQKIFPINDQSQEEFLMCTNLVLGEAVKTGLIKKKFGLYFLTAEGRKKVEVDMYSLFKNTFNSIQDFC
jgi:hypothetical protein